MIVRENFSQNLFLQHTYNYIVWKRFSLSAREKQIVMEKAHKNLVYTIICEANRLLRALMELPENFDEISMKLSQSVSQKFCKRILTILLVCCEGKCKISLVKSCTDSSKITELTNTHSPRGKQAI